MSFDITVAKKNPDLPEEMIEEFASVYRNTIFVPDKKPKKQFLLCPVGLVGAGKTTVVKPLSEKLHLVRVSTDEIRKMLKEKGYNYSKIRDISLKIVESFIKNGYSITIDGNCGVLETQNYIKEAERKYGLQTIWIHVNPPEEFIVKKLQNFPHTWLFENGDEAIKAYYEYKKKHDYSQSLIPFLYTFDTSKNDLSQQLEEAEKLINNVIMK